MEFGNLTFDEIRKCADEGWLAIVPTGCTEQQGPHLPVDIDTWFVKTACLAASEYIEKEYSIYSLVLPVLPFGPTPEHKGFGSGYIDMPQEVHSAVIKSILNSLAEQRFRRIILWKGCGGHELSQVVAEFNEIHEGFCKTYYPELPYHEIWCKIGNPDVPGGHADSFITSISMHLRPEVVRNELISNPHNEPVDWKDPDLDFSRYSSTGVIGDPTKATDELGAELWEAVVKRLAGTIKEYAEIPFDLRKSATAASS
jgi:creatinine amidohydrolase